MKCHMKRNEVVAILSLSARRAWIEIPMRIPVEMSMRSLSARRAWIEIAIVCVPRGCCVSLSARRAWIEIGCCCVSVIVSLCRSPQGERGLKSLGGPPPKREWRRSPQGERGLKLDQLSGDFYLDAVALRKESVD